MGNLKEIKKNNPQKAVAVIFSNVNLYDFLWYYCTYGQDYEWTAITEFYFNTKIELTEECRKLGIFKDVRFVNVNTRQISVTKKAYQFLKMFFFFLTGNRDKYCKKLISEGVEEWDLAVVANPNELLHGAFISQSYEKEIVILEDGNADTLETFHKFERSHGLKKTICNLIDFMCSKMGYFDPGNRYELKTVKNCIKYASNPLAIQHRSYKQIKKLHDNTQTDMNLYNHLLQRWCGDIFEKQFKADLILYTSPMDLFENDIEMKNKVENHIIKNYSGKTMLLKKHPRDLYKYDFGKDIKVIEIPSSLPAEIFVNNVEIEYSLFEYPTNVLEQYRGKSKKVMLLFFLNAKICNGRLDYRNLVVKYAEYYGFDKKNIVSV